jgi:hypothetical protein
VTLTFESVDASCNTLFQSASKAYRILLADEAMGSECCRQDCLFEYGLLATIFTES